VNRPFLAFTCRAVVVSGQRDGPFGFVRGGPFARKAVLPVRELLDQHVPAVHVDVLDDQFMRDERPPRQIDEDALRRHEGTVGGPESFDDEIVDLECAGEQPDLQLADVGRPIEPARSALLRPFPRRGAEID